MSLLDVGEFSNTEYLSYEELNAVGELSNYGFMSHVHLLQGKIIVFEGADKLGKSTLIKLFSYYLNHQSSAVNTKVFSFPNREDHLYLVRLTKDPESTIQQKILSHALSHALTYPMILNHVLANGLALCDRYWYSNLVYPTTLHNVSPDLIWSVEHDLVNPPTPHLTVFFLSDNMYPSFSQSRENTDELDRLELQDRKKILLKYEEMYHSFSSSNSKRVTQHCIAFQVYNDEPIGSSLVRLAQVIYDSIIHDTLRHNHDVLKSQP
jgi:thymidylate kinase